MNDDDKHDHAWRKKAVMSEKTKTPLFYVIQIFTTSATAVVSGPKKSTKNRPKKVKARDSIHTHLLSLPPSIFFYLYR